MGSRPDDVSTVGMIFTEHPDGIPAWNGSAEREVPSLLILTPYLIRTRHVGHLKTLNRQLNIGSFPVLAGGDGDGANHAVALMRTVRVGIAIDKGQRNHPFYFKITCDT